LAAHKMRSRRSSRDSERNGGPSDVMRSLVLT
jgi:hypothetical protein